MHCDSAAVSHATGVAVVRSLVRISAPTPDGFIGDIEPSLGEEFLDVSIAQREAQVEPDRMLNDHRRKAVAAVGDFSHCLSLPVVSPPNYPVILTIPFVFIGVCIVGRTAIFVSSGHLVVAADSATGSIFSGSLFDNAAGPS
jgi:hypothetical protein